jgi:Glyoxalase/Bleomycin resistance protein/Dioxygenase superfamily
MKAEDLFHTGIVVDDVDATLAQLTDLFGYEWCETIAMPTPVALPTGDVTLDFRITYSMTTPRLEIIESIRGTVWVPAAGSGIHHIGYWSDDVARDSAALRQRGLPREAAGTRPDGITHWAYHRGPTGPRIELMATELRPVLEQIWATGKL